VQGERWSPFKKAERRFEPSDPHVRFEVIFPRGTTKAAIAAYKLAFRGRLKDQRIAIKDELTTLEDGRISYSIRKTVIPGSFDRLFQALGDEFGVYPTPSKSDVLVISQDPALRGVNGRIDLMKETKLRGGELVENALGLILGEARKGGKKGSASRIVSFTGYRERYMSEYLVQQDAIEEHINFFSGHIVHEVNGWLVSELQHGRVPTREQYEEHLLRRWNDGIREIKPVGIPKGQRMENLRAASLQRALNMYEHVLRLRAKGEIFIGTEIPNFIVIEDYKRGEDTPLRERYIVHTIFDFVALRPIPGKPGHARLVTYDFKTGPTKSKGKLEQDDQVRTYSLFNYERWVGKPFPEPYMTGENSYIIDDAVVEFIYSAGIQTPEVTGYAREAQRSRIIRVFDAISRTEAKLSGVTPSGAPNAANRKASAKAKAAKAKKKPAPRRKR
jgi:hypothetical protein